MRILCKYSPGHKGQIREINELIITNYKAAKPQIDIFDDAEIEIQEVTDEERMKAIHDIKLKHEQDYERQTKEIRENVLTGKIADDATQADLFS
jgi:hypothetical protein